MNDNQDKQIFNRNNVKFWKYHIIYNNITYTQHKTNDMEMSCICVPPRSYNFSPFGNIKKKRKGGLEDIKAEVEETLSEGRPSSPHAVDPYASQDA